MSYANLASEMASAIDEAGEIKSVAVRGAICELLVQVNIEMARKYHALPEGITEELNVV